MLTSISALTSFFPRGRRPAISGFTWCWVICCFIGCGESAQSRLDKAIPVRDKVVPVKGIVTVDSTPTGELTVRLVKDGAKAPAPTDPKTLTKPDGKFHFTTYLDGDGVRPGKYLVLIERLTKMGSGGWTGPDKLNNLYNHLTEPAATIDVTEGAPISDLKIELEFQGKAPKKSPPYGATHSGKPMPKGKR